MGTISKHEEEAVRAIAKGRGLDYAYVLEGIIREGGVRDGRLVSLTIVNWPKRSLELEGLDALERLHVVGALPHLVLRGTNALVELSLSDTQLESLDASSLPSLEVLKLARTRLATLPPFPITLKSLECADVLITSFRAKLPALTSLDLGRCGLESLDVVGVPALRRLVVADNHLAALDLRPLGALERAELQRSGAKNTVLPDAPLTLLSMTGTPLSSFDASPYPKLATLFVDAMGLADLTLSNPALEHLGCANNHLRALDLSTTPHLRRLAATGNAIATLDLRPLHDLRLVAIDAKTNVECTELQKHMLLRERFGLPKATKTLAKMDAYQLHALALDYNWDAGVGRLLEVVRHPKCALATALLIYWQSEPADISPSEKKVIQLLRTIEAGVENKTFAESAIRFDERDVDGVDLSDDDPKIPAFMRQAL